MIPVANLRDLVLERAEGDEHSVRPSAASALIHVGSTLFLATDDERQLSIFPEEGRVPGKKVQILDGPTPHTEEERKATKPDIESLTLLPSADAFPNGAFLALPSGTKDRDHGALIRLGSDHSVVGSEQVDVGPLYEALRREVDSLNIEGAAVRGETLHILQRGNAEDAINARIDLSLSVLVDSLKAGRAPGPEALIDITPYELGQIRGVKLSFSDASPLADGRLVFACSAETSGPSGDGEVLGSALGTMSAEGEIDLIEPVDLEVKIEGMTAMEADPDIRVLLVTDGDEPEDPSPLLEAWIPGG